MNDSRWYDAETETRMALDVDEQIRIAALNAAIANFAIDNKAPTMHTLLYHANALADWIVDGGDAPNPPAGMTW